MSNKTSIDVSALEGATIKSINFSGSKIVILFKNNQKLEIRPDAFYGNILRYSITEDNEKEQSE